MSQSNFFDNFTKAMLTNIGFSARKNSKNGKSFCHIFATTDGKALNFKNENGVQLCLRKEDLDINSSIGLRRAVLKKYDSRSTMYGLLLSIYDTLGYEIKPMSKATTQIGAINETDLRKLINELVLERVDSLQRQIEDLEQEVGYLKQRLP